MTGPSLTSSTVMAAPNAPRRAPALAEPLVERLGVLGAGRGDVGGTVALPRVAVERELGDAQDLAVAQRLVHPSLRVREHPQRADLVGQAVGLLLGVAVAHAQQHQQTRADRRHLRTVHGDRRPRDPLHQRAHQATVSTISAIATTRPVLQATAPAAIRMSRPYACATTSVLIPHGMAASSR
ncbi:MAG: hypothetical protein QOI91_302 [Solirubrobacteraceae bacterium]|nr:hypothetical protein [Solirubrobacteraceae bacterium]